MWTEGGSAPIPQLLKPGELDALMLPWAKKVAASRARPDRIPTTTACRAGRCGSPAGLPGASCSTRRSTPRTSSCCRKETRTPTGRSSWTAGSTPRIPTPTWYGHSIGRWEGSTLVIDTVGLHDRFWLDSAGTPHTEKLHLVERWTRTDFTTLRRDVTIDDPGTFTKPFTVTYTAKLAEPGSEILEYICIENNQYGLPQGNTNPKVP